jgi:serine/threonine protein kinase
MIIYYFISCVSLIMQHCSYSNLDNLLKNTGCLQENILKQITFRILKALEIFNTKSGDTFDCLSPNNILFDFKCNLKVRKKFIYFLK